MEVSRVDSLRGSTAIVTGASRGLGREIALQLAREGAWVMAAARSNQEALISLLEEIRREGGDGGWRLVDVGDPDQCSELVNGTVKEKGGLDVLVNNAGLGHWALVEDTSDEQWRQTMRVNVDGTFYLSRAAIGPMRETGGGHIVNVASVAGRKGRARFSAYCAAKAAAIVFSEALAAEVRRYGIQVSVILPGTADTEFRKDHAGRPPTPDITEPDRMLTAGDVASAVVWALKSSHHVAALQIVLEPKG
jgi:3-oxoacyl-[acyl-carrier protein] reductase